MAVAAILVSANALAWRRGDVDLGFGVKAPVRVGLISLEVCAPALLETLVGNQCERTGFEEIAAEGGIRRAQKVPFIVASKVTYGLSIAASALLLGALAIAASGALAGRAAKLAAMACASYALSGIATISLWSGLVVDVGWAFWLALVGAILGVVAAGSLLMPAEDELGGELAPSLKARLEGARSGPVAQAAVSAPAFSGAVAPAAPSAPARALGPNPFDAAVRGVAGDATAATLRFCARDMELRDRGMVVTQQDDAVRFVEYAQVAGIVVRSLPPEPPFEGRVVMDLVPAPDGEGRRAPVRLLGTTRVNYTALPKGAGTTSADNLRRLADFIMTTQPSIVRDPDLAAFLAGSPPRRYQSLKEFLAYDAGFTAT